ncbi:hypothetical protein NPIL_395701 [Nephila pilipes]|uniref:Uncharacterized protein n=1 Tax=Nephila pilipes TaxID=299642 RepID=A0A8X6KL52_NEPPI|nr:hypothetical protein NPIL_395701 [Nephila pilipes]
MDKVLSAEIPDPKFDGMFEIGAKSTIHGPCGTINTNSQCMIDGNALHGILESGYHVGSNGYPLYRRKAQKTIEKKLL